MAGRSWTEAQTAAILDEGGSLLVDAAAGSGKTAVLVERAVRLMTRDEAPMRADRLLILTFTNAAADELRARLAGRLEAALLEAPGNHVLRRQKMLLKRAFIGTIDAYCMQLVREHFAALNLPPDVAVGQPAVLQALSAAALDETMEEMVEDEDFARFIALYGRSRSDAEAADAILRLCGYVDSLPWPETQLRRFAGLYQSAAPLAETEWGQELLAYARQALEAALALAQAAHRSAEEDGGLDAWLPALAEDMDALARLHGAALQGWDEAERLLRGFFPARLPAVRGYEGEGKELVQTLRAEMKKALEALRKNCFVCTEAEYREDLAEAAPLVAALCRAAESYTRRYGAAKLEARALDFSDFEHLALRLLQGEDGRRSEAAEELCARYDAVMVDEYQDTNELQSALYACLGRADGSNLFYVGDVKQSIYRFRRANPGLFLAKKAAWAPYESGCHPAVLRLGHNFRSGPSVIGGVNFLFRELMSEALGEVDYGPGEQLIQGLPGGIEQGFTLLFAEDPEGEGEAALLAARIRQMVAEKTTVFEDGQPRPCGYGDFCILLRTRGAMAEYQAALESQGVPAVCDADDELLQSPEVLPLRAVLAAIDNPGDDVNLAAAMLGPLFRFTPDEITALRAGQPQGSLYGAVAASPSPKAAAFLQSLAQYRRLSSEMHCGRLCEELVLRSGYLSATGAMEGGAARQENLRRFLAFAGEMGGVLSGGLSAFVRLLENGRGPSASGYKGLPGHVSLLTAHKSKGLEFPIVFFADTARQFNMRDRAERIQLHAQLGVGLWLRSGQTLFPTLPLMAIRRRCEREALSEEMRVLYVALTRARDRLFLCYTRPGAVQKLQGLATLAAAGALGGYQLSRGHCFGEWLLAALLRHPAAGALWELAGLEAPPGFLRETACHLSTEFPAPLPAEDSPEGFTLSAEPQPQQVQALLAAFAQQPPRAPLRDMPRKLSVSALSKSGQPGPRRRPSLVYQSGLTAAERGTAMHSFLQNAGLSAAAENLEGEIARLAQLGLLGEAEAKALDRAGLAAFFASPLAGRMRAAKRLLREYDFITALPAKTLNPSLPAELASQPVYLQGIADAVLVGEGGAEIADYKTDRGKSEDELRAAYAGQLSLYAAAIEKRLGLPVRRLTLWSFALGREVDLPLGQPPGFV